MNVLVVGSGGREHAMAWKLAQSPAIKRLCCVPGNPGMASLADCKPAHTGSPQELLAIAESIGADWTIVGPEVPLVAGIVDVFHQAGRRVIGPVAAAARLEGSKVFSKQFMRETGVPTAEAVMATSADEACDALKKFSCPVVLKADGLAAGKGVIIAESHVEAEEGLAKLPPGPIVVEEFLRGEEVSFIVYATADKVLPLEATQDHKAIFDDDRGPNTGGMGAYCDGRIINSRQAGEVMERIILPVLDGMAKRGTPFHGFLYAGLMMTAEGPKVLEFNVRLGDPEAQALLHRLDNDLAAVLFDGEQPRWKPEPSVCVVMAAAGYPGDVRKGDLITGIEECGAVVYQAGTRLAQRGLETAGGRVLGVTAAGPTLPEAIENTYAALRRIHFDGMQYRSDIGRKGLKRW